MPEAGVQQVAVWGGADESQHILIAVARYLAAHSPTERAALQTADVRKPGRRERAEIAYKGRLGTTGARVKAATPLPARIILIALAARPAGGLAANDAL
jgi:hypothetical protein